VDSTWNELSKTGLSRENGVEVGDKVNDEIDSSEIEGAMGVSKSHLRKRLRQARKAHPAREVASEQILGRLADQRCFQEAQFVAWYVDAGSEVITRWALQAALNDVTSDASANTTVHATPFCLANDLLFYSLRSWQELEGSKYDILAPSETVRQREGALVNAGQFDVVLVPGVGFDLRGNRIGQGKGYYDRFLTGVRDDAVKIGLAFDCQLADEVPHDQHDQTVDFVITESRLIGC